MKNKILLIIAAVAFLIFFGWLFMLENNGNNEAAKENNPAIDYAPLSFPNNTIDTSDWETYRNEEFGFEVKYPDEWVLLNQEKLTVSDIFAFGQKKNFGLEGYDGELFIFVDKKPLDEIIRDINPQDLMLKSRFIYNNTKGVIFDYKLGVWSKDRGYPDERITLQNYVFDGGRYRYSLYGPTSDISSQRILEQMVFSFKLR